MGSTLHQTFALVPKNQYELDLIGGGKLDSRNTRQVVVESSTNIQTSRYAKTKLEKGKETIIKAAPQKKS